jgi:integrase
MEKYKLKSGEYRYREMIYIDGKLKKSPAFKRKSDALTWKAQQKANRDKVAALGIKHIQTQKVTFIDFANNWLNENIKFQKSQATFIEYQRIVNTHLLRVLNSKLIGDITKKDADTLVKDLKQRGHNDGGINKILGVLKSILIFAETNEVISKNPLYRYSNLKENKVAAQFWTKSEINQFLRFSRNSSLYPLYVVALNCGLRRGELAGLKWDKIHFENKLIEVSRVRDRYGLRERTKGSKTRFVPMNDIVLKTLLDIKQVTNSDFVFTNDDDSPISVQHLYRTFKKAQVDAGLSNIIKFHGLRHTMASNFMMSGGNVYDLQKILGHSKIEMTEIYAHLSPVHLANTTSILNFHGNSEHSYPNSNHELDREKKSELLIFDTKVVSN